MMCLDELSSRSWQTSGLFNIFGCYLEAEVEKKSLVILAVYTQTAGNKRKQEIYRENGNKLKRIWELDKHYPNWTNL